MTASTARLSLAVVSAICLAAMSYLSVTYLSPGNLGIFDTRAFGYDLNFARAYVRALGTVETAIYTGPFRVFDTMFPICFATLLAMLLHDRTRTWTVVSQLLLMVLPGGYLVMDLAENALIAQIVSSNLSDLRAEGINLASRFTVTKYVMLGATILAILAADVLRRRR